VIFGPDADGSRYDAAVFPFARDAILKKDWGLATKQLKKTADLIKRATDMLIH
jgi:N-acetylated-alpha-linked acidic dipeptidase